jgi:hypothetical protein
VITLQLVACTLDAGSPWVAVAGGSLSLGFDPGARGLPGGGVVSDRAATWRLDAFDAEVSSVDLEELQGAGNVSFDPADPPPGYSLCHEIGRAHV